MQYISKGPDIPEEVELALANEDLVLFCGAGISAQNGLPLFKDLVERVCKELLHIDIKEKNLPKEWQLLREAWKSKNYDNVLDLIEAKVSQQTLRKKIINILSNATEKADANIHKYLLELSTLKDKKGYRLVTTNFDRLFFKAELNYKLSDSAPKLAPPREETWNHLTFLHGVIDEDSDPFGSNLIITRRDFGLAYLYDNWVSRFIIQLFQDFTILFIGYGVNDPVMNYLMSAISYENQRRKENQRNGENSHKIKPSMYAFVGYKEDEKEKKENKWKSIGIEPIPYKIKVTEGKEGKKEEDHSLLYETIQEWAGQKRKGLIGKKNRLKEKVKIPYKESDKETAESVISYLKVDEKLAQYFPQIDLSSDPHKITPVDISWLKPLNKSGLLDKLRDKKAISVQSGPWIRGLVPLWECLSTTEYNIAKWLCLHLDKKELIHWVIEKECVLHPHFKEMIRMEIESIKNNKLTLENRKLLFWKIITNNSYSYYEHNQHNMDYHVDYKIINTLNEQYCKIKARELLECLKPYIHFKAYLKDEIWVSELKINMTHYPNKHLKNKETLIYHAEDFSNLLKNAMELAELSEIIKNGKDHFYIKKPSIEVHGQNTNYYPWTYLIDLVRDSFDCAMKENKKELTELLLKKWQCYSYSIFYRLILYAVTKYSGLDEKIALDLLENKTNHILWSVSCQNEVFKYLKERTHSKSAINKLLSLIVQGPSRDLFSFLDEDSFNQLKATDIYDRLNCLKKEWSFIS